MYARRGAAEWVLTESTGLDDTLDLASIACSVTLDEVYAKVSLAAAKKRA